MTNPNDAVRVSSRKGGRGSVYEANAWAQLYNNGILSGNGVTPDTGMTVQLGGTTACPDVVIATTPVGYKVALDIVDTATVTVTKPASNKKIVAIVAYTNDLSVASTESNITGNPASCGLIAVDGTVSANPIRPSAAQIATAINADGGTGTTAAYAIIATILLTSSTTSVTSGIITRNNAVSGMIDVFYPVGSYYETTNTAFDPNVSWGGTWVEDSAGRVLVSKDSGTFATVGDTGGAETKKLGARNIPQMYWHTDGLTGDTIQADFNAGGSNGNHSCPPANGGNTAFEAISLLQPYIVVKRWHRTA